MPALPPAVTVRLELPSTKGQAVTDRGVVWLQPLILAGEYDQKLTQSEAFKALIDIALIARHIVAWNYTDVTGEILPITEEAVSNLPAMDYHYMISKMQLGKTLTRQQVQRLILHLDNAAEGKASSYQPPVSYLLYRYRQRWQISYQEAMQTPWSVIMQDEEFDSIAAQRQPANP